MTLEPTVTLERPVPERATPSSAPTPSAPPRVTASASPFTPSSSLPTVPVAQYPTTAIAAPGIHALTAKTKLETSLVFEDTGSAYVLRSIVGTSAGRAPLWTGMAIDKTEFADLLGRLQKNGFAEFATVGAANGNPERAAFRSALQANPGEWVTLVRVAHAHGDAVVAFLSPASLQVHLPAFHSAGMPAAKAA